MIRGRASAARASAVVALLVAAAACGSNRDPAFELGSGEFPWSALMITAFGDLEPVAEVPTVPPSEWRRAFPVDGCQFGGIIYGIGWPIPGEGSAAVRIEDCAPDPELASAERCQVTLDSFALTLRPDFDEPVIDAATVELANPVVTDEGWSSWGLMGAGTAVTGAITITGRDGGAPTRYELDYFELQLDYVRFTYFFELGAIKPGW